MRIKASELIFLGRIHASGTGIEPLENNWRPWMEDEEYEVNCLSISRKTYIARNGASFIVKLKPGPERPVIINKIAEVLGNRYDTTGRQDNYLAAEEVIKILEAEEMIKPLQSGE